MNMQLQDYSIEAEPLAGQGYDTGDLWLLAILAFGAVCLVVATIAQVCLWIAR